MADRDGVPPLADGEILYRRIPAKPQFYDPASGVRELAFKPTRNDVDGLSLSREPVGPVGAAATGPVGRAFYVASFRAGDLSKTLGLTVMPDGDDHAVIADLTHAIRQSKDPAVRARLDRLYGQLVGAVVEVTGPYPGAAVAGPPMGQ